MSKKAMTFRLGEAARLRLAELASGRRCSATRVVEDLLLGSSGSWSVSQKIVDAAPVPVVGEATSGSEELREGSVSVKRTLGGVKRVQAIPRPGWKK